MPNVNSGGTPLLPPSQLWGPKQPAPATPGQVQPARPVPSGSQGLPSLPGNSSVPTTLPKLPPMGKAMPLLSLSGQPPTPTLGSKLTQFKDMVKNADSRLMDYYQIKLVKNDQGGISGFMLNGKAASAAEIQGHLLPQSGVLHQQITDLKAEIAQTHQNFLQQLQVQFPSLAPTEQTAVKIQAQAVQVVYDSFVSRLNEIDSLIK
jgi:hypothetical protein